MDTGKIVVVDDEKIVTSAFSTLLKVEGFNDIHCFNSPKEALEFLKDNKPDIVISDFLMPEMNGLEFLKCVNEIYSEVSKILLTGYADKENAIKEEKYMLKLPCGRIIRVRTASAVPVPAYRLLISLI